MLNPETITVKDIVESINKLIQERSFKKLPAEKKKTQIFNALDSLKLSPKMTNFYTDMNNLAEVLNGINLKKLPKDLEVFEKNIEATKSTVNDSLEVYKNNLAIWEEKEAKIPEWQDKLKIWKIDPENNSMPLVIFDIDDVSLYSSGGAQLATKMSDFLSPETMNQYHEETKKHAEAYDLEVIPETLNFVNKLKEADIPYIFVTSRNSKDKEENHIIYEKTKANLEKQGLLKIDKDSYNDVYTIGRTNKEYLAKKKYSTSSVDGCLQIFHENHETKKLPSNLEVLTIFDDQKSYRREEDPEMKAYTSVFTRISGI